MSLAAMSAVVIAASLVQGTAGAESSEPQPVPSDSPGAGSEKLAAKPGPDSVAADQRDGFLGTGWKSSMDRAWTTSGDAQGFHILVAEGKNGYSWKTAASLSEPGFDTDLWIGNACVTGSGKRAVVAYAPRTFTNKAELMARGAFTAVVDLETGKVTKLPKQASLAYFSPGCGTGETAVFTQGGGETKNSTRLVKVDAVHAELSKPIELKGQVTSAVPVGSDILAADSARIIKINSAGHRTVVVDTAQVPFLLKPDADGGVVYMDRPFAPALPGAKTLPEAEAQGTVERVSAADISRGTRNKTKPAVLATGALAKMDLSSSASGQVFITGDTKSAAKLPNAVRRRTDLPKEVVTSTKGEAVVTATTWADGKDSRITQEEALTTRVARLDLKVLKTGKSSEFQVTPDKDGVAEKISGSVQSPALSVPKSAAKSSRVAAAGGTVDDGRVCAVARNDPAKQAMQPKPRQVEWAVNQAITGNLNKWISRPANWKNLGMAAYQPQTLFPLKPLTGGGRIPSQVMLGITAQESNMWQASRVVVPGVTGNPLIGNYYGTPYSSSGSQGDPWAIDWSQADCGYGITQVTDGMRLAGHEKPGETSLPVLKQEAIALDYTANIAAGVNILVDKWNQTKADGLIIDNGDPKWAENWFFALWAYNAGYYPKASAASNGGQWGVGFTNNPANPLWKANRNTFLEKPDGSDNYADAAHPQDWPYPEKVIGWGARPPALLESPGTMVAGFRAGWWTNNTARTNQKPPIGLFCTTANQCDPTKISDTDSNQPGMGACTRTDLRCWWNTPVSWKSCAANLCENETLRFDSTYAEQADGTAYPPNCVTTGLPGNALIVDDVADSAPIHRPGCTPRSSDGTFSFDFKSNSANIDLHQLGAGYNSHFWFAHMRNAGETDRLGVTGTWTLGKALGAPRAKLLVHIPDHGAQATQARYQVSTPLGVKEVTVSQAAGAGTNRWVDLGIYGFEGVTPKVQLSNLDPSATGTGDQDVAFDAIAFVPGDYATIPTITLPKGAVPPDSGDEDSEDDGNYNHDEPYRYIPKGTVFGTGFLTKSASLKSIVESAKSSAPAPACQEAKNKKGEFCVTVTPVDNSKSSARGNLANSSATCLTRQYDRDTACLGYEVVLTWTIDGTPVAEGTWQWDETIKLDRYSRNFKTTIDVTPTVVDPKLGVVTLNPTLLCAPYCEYNAPVLNWGAATPTWAVGDKTPRHAVVTNSWSSTSTHDEDTMILGWQLEGIATVGISKPISWREPSLEVRCDKKGPGTRSPGCVFPSFIPTYELSVADYPAAAAMYWVLMKKLPNHPGSAEDNSPLHREASRTARNENRRIICSQWNPANFIRHPDTPNASCDEYPFAASKESGGQTLTSGSQCVQIYATDSSGSWKIYEDRRESPPTWKEICGRGSIPLDQNRNAGSGLPGFFNQQRVWENGEFYVGILGLENCNPDEVCTVAP